MKPLLKWVGGKTQLLNEVLQEIPDNISGTYHEPFVGDETPVEGPVRHVSFKQLECVLVIYPTPVGG